jgi:hypothetical protein
VHAPASTVLVALCVVHPLAAQTTCTAWQDCRQEALAARDRGDGETFHDLAWRTVQTGPKNDPTLLFLLARAQSLSGRPHDAMVMLERLLERGVDIADAETSDDFRRVRTLAAWPTLLDRMRGSVSTKADNGSPAATTPVPVSNRTAALRKPAPAARPIASRAPVLASPARKRLAASAAAAPGGGPAAGGMAAGSTPDAAPLHAWPLPASIRAPLAMAYDRVSGRLVLAHNDGEALKVLSEVSGNAVDFVRRGWAGPYRATAMAIDAARGDLWVAADATDADAMPGAAVLHRVQLISGRLLYSVPVAAKGGPVSLSSLAVAGSRVVALDAAGGRLFELTGPKTLQERVRLAIDGAASVALAGPDVAYVAHAGGLLRVPLTGGRPVAVSSASGISLANLQWIGLHRQSLLGIEAQPDGTWAAVRLRLDSRGRAITSREELGRAASPAATLMRDEFFYVAVQDDGSTAVRRHLVR